MSKRSSRVEAKPEKKVDKIEEPINLFSKQNLLFLAIILLITSIVFWKALKNGFTDWDDDVYVVNSELIKHIDVIAYFKSLTANLYTPLVTFSYAIDFKLYGMNAVGFHATNLLLHAINVLLVFTLTFRLFKKSGIAAITTLLFAIHPLNVEAVVWISSRKDLLFTLFYLLGMLTYLRYIKKKQLGWLVLVFLLFVLSVLSKPIAFTFPIALLLLDYFEKQEFTKRNFLEKIPFLLISLAVAFMGIYLVKKYEVFASAPAGYNLFDKICLAGFSLVFYLYNALIPADISNYHAYPFKEGSFLNAKYIFAPLVGMLSVVIAYLAFKKNFKMIAGFILFLIIIGPTLRLIPTGYPIAADRYFYLASIGLFWTVILLFQRIYNYSFAVKYFIVTIGVVFTFAFIVVSYKRVSDWKDSYTLWNSTLKNYPAHEIANDHLGKLYDNAGKKDLALIHFQSILERDTTKYDIMNSAGNILIEKKEPKLAMKYFSMAIATGKADHLPYYNRGMLYSDEHKFQLAIKDFDKAIQLKPDFAEGFNNRGIAKVQFGDTLGAYQDFENAVKFKPADQMMQDNLARIKHYLPSK
jgi:tetratricopeptide (TPR) repeat protein